MHQRSGNDLVGSPCWGLKGCNQSVGWGCNLIKVHMEETPLLGRLGCWQHSGPCSCRFANLGSLLAGSQRLPRTTRHAAFCTERSQQRQLSPPKAAKVGAPLKVGITTVHDVVTYTESQSDSVHCVLLVRRDPRSLPTLEARGEGGKGRRQRP